MYSRYHSSDERPMRLPENYGGSAFSQSDRTEPPHRIDVAKPSPPQASRPSLGMPPPPRPVTTPPPRERPPEPPLPPSCPACEPVHESPADDDRPQKEKAPDPPLSGLSGLFGNLGHAFPFSHGIGSDELLLLGLILLLARSESDSDLVLWLALLLFCG